MKKTIVNKAEFAFFSLEKEDFISLTDLAKYKSDDPNSVIANWIRNRNSIEYLGLWETLHNNHFKPLEFEGFRKLAGLNAFTLSPKKWIETTGARGILVKSGRYGGTFAHRDIAFHFAEWISVEFGLYVAMEFQRLKQAEQRQLDWTVKRELSRLNYHIHTDAIKEHLIPEELTPSQISFVYADEADVLNVAIFGMTARQWREQNPGEKGNIRDCATINQLICLSNLESLNAVFIHEGMGQAERLKELNKIAIHQMNILERVNHRNILK